MDNTTTLRRTSKVTIYPGDSGVRLDELEEQIAAARLAEKSRKRRVSEKLESDALAQQYDDLRDSLAKDAVTVTLQALPRRKFRELVEAHPPREGEGVPETVVESDKRLGVNESTFFDVAVPASVLSVVGFDGDTLAFLDDLSEPDWRALATHVFGLNNARVDLPKESMASAVRQMRDDESRSRSDSESAREGSTGGSPRRLTSRTMTSKAD